MPDDLNEVDRAGSDAVALVRLGSQMAGNAAGAAIGFLSAGPAGAVAGAASGAAFTHIFERIGAEVRRRLLGPREEARVGAAFIFAVQKVKENLDMGRAPREDGFFAVGVDGRSTADEIVEGALLVAQREHEEKKVRFIGYLVGNIPFFPVIDRGTANLLLFFADRLSYRQLVLLQLFADSGRYNLRKTRFGGGNKLSANQIAAIQEASDLDSLNLVATGDVAIFGPSGVIPSETKPQAIGVFLHQLMELRRIDADDVEQVAKLLR